MSIVRERKFLESFWNFDRFLIYCFLFFRQNAGVKSGAADWKDTANVVISEAWAENSDY